MRNTAGYGFVRETVAWFRRKTWSVLGGLICGLSLLSSCADHSYPGEEALTEEVEITPESSYPIIISVGNSILDESTPDMASRASSFKYPIYVYSFKKDLVTDFRVTATENREMCLVDGSMAPTPTLQGKKAYVGTEEPYLVWSEEPATVYYLNSNQPYDVYGYYLDGLELTDEAVDRTQEGIRLKVNINGRQDLMSSKAVVTDEQLKQANIPANDWALMREQCFSGYTAASNIQPMLEFKHHLTKLVFRLYPAVQNAWKTTINGITVRAKTEGYFTVAHSSVGNMGVNFSETATYGELPLTEADGTTLLTDTYRPVQEGVDYSLPVYERPSVQVGDCLMVPPGETTYECEVQMTQLLDDGTLHSFKNTLHVTNGQAGFQAGNQYTVKLAIYGLQEIGIDVSVSPWIDGGDVSIDPDEEMGKHGNR